MESIDEQYKVVISEKATEMLVQHLRFIAEVSHQAADTLRAEIIESAKSLQSFPERNMIFFHPVLPTKKYRKMTIGKRYLLIYQIKNRTVYIEYILDCRQDYRWLL